MSFLTDNRLANVYDMPVALPATELRQGDWLVIATLKVVESMRVTWKHVNLSLLSCSVDTSLITSGNRVAGNLGLVYLTLRKDYAGDNPNAAEALDVFGVSTLGTFVRPTTPEVVIVEPGDYAWVVANNMQPSSSSSVPSSSSIDFFVSVSGIARLEFGGA